MPSPTKTIRVSIAALAAARKTNLYAIEDLCVETVATYFDEQFAPAIPLLEKLEKSVENGLLILTPDILTLNVRSHMEADLSDIRTALHRLKPMNQEIPNHD